MHLLNVVDVSALSSVKRLTLDHCVAVDDDKSLALLAVDDLYVRRCARKLQGALYPTYAAVARKAFRLLSGAGNLGTFDS